MTQVPTRESVLADFDDAKVRFFGREFRFYTEDGAYFMDMQTEPSSSLGEPPVSETYELVLSTGAHHQQAFWFATDEEGRSLGKLPLIWLVAEQRWVPYGSIFLAPPSRPSMGKGLWNKNCIKCHVVGGRPRPEPESGHDSHVTEFGIACESCHGEGREHATHHRNPLSRYREHLSERDDPTLVNPADLSHDRSSQVCGQCHSVFDFDDADDKAAFDLDGFTYRPGDDLHASRHVFRLGHDEDLPVFQRKRESSPRYFDRRFWSDGMVRVSGREYNGMLETPCFQRGEMSCASCHSMHGDVQDRRSRAEWADDQLKPDMRENEACLQCHEQWASEDRLAEHTRHAPESSGSLCYNCHMPHTTLGLMKAMRSHTVDTPSVASSVETGRPNACNLCHLDEPLAWTAAHLREGWGIQSPPLDQDDRNVAASIRWLLEGDAGQRAIVGWHYGWGPAQAASGTDWMAPYLAELLDDSYDVVRFTGGRSLRTLPDYVDFDYDYVASKGSREGRRLGALGVWRRLADRPSPSAAVLIDENGTLAQDEFERLRSRRLDPPMVLAE